MDDADPIVSLQEQFLLAQAKRVDQKLREQARRKKRWRELHKDNLRPGEKMRLNAKAVITCKGERFKSVRLAIRFLKKTEGITRTTHSVYYALQNPFRTCANRRWAYESDGRPENWAEPIVVSPQLFKKGIGTSKRRADWVIITDRHERFETAKLAQDAVGCLATTIRNACSKVNRVIAGRRWAYEKDGRPKEWKKRIKRRQAPSRRKLPQKVKRKWVRRVLVEAA